MSETTRTLTFAGVAMALLAAATLSSWLPDIGGGSAEFEDQGGPFFPAFAEALGKDPLSAKVLEIVEYDSPYAKAFQVQFKDGRWTIPSHHDYPAKAQDRIARLAAAVAGLKKDTIRSDRADDQEALGVVDPLDTKTTSLKGRGTHVTLRERPGGQALADLIIGGEVPDRPGMRYVRQAGKNRTYGVNLSLDLSTDFANWIDTNLVDVTPTRVTRLEYDTRKVDPEQFTVTPGDPITLERQSGAASGPSSWSLVGLDPDQTVDTNKVEDVIRAVDSLRVVGVRPLPQQSSNEGLVRSLASKGFYLTRQGELLSNEGSVKLSTDEGIRFTLRFGEVTFASGDTLTAGKDEDRKMAGAELVEEQDQSSSADAQGAEKKAETESRFVIVTVEFDPTLIPEEGSSVDSIPDDPFARAADDPIRVAAEKKSKEEVERRGKDREQKVASGEKKVEELNQTLKNWYYVVPGADFRRVFVGRGGFVRNPDAPTQPEPGSTATGPGGGLPPGLNLPPLGNPR